MRLIAASFMVLIAMSGQASGFGIIVEGQGNLALDADVLHSASIYDYDRNGRPDIVSEVGAGIVVTGLDGSTLWSVEVDTLEICPECTGPGGWWSVYFEGFFALEPGQYDVLFGYYYDNFDTGTYANGLLVISVAGGAIRYQLAGRYLEACVDLDNDGYEDIACGRDNGGTGSTWEIWGRNGVAGVPSGQAGQLYLDQNHPNPFNPWTTVRFTLASAGNASIEIHNAAGRLIFTRPMGELPAGMHEFTWNGRDRRGRRMASGTYFITVLSEGDRQSRKMVMVK